MFYAYDVCFQKIRVFWWVAMVLMFLNYIFKQNTFDGTLNENQTLKYETTAIKKKVI